MTKRALCVGVNRYRDPALSSLRGAVNDARTMSLVLVRDFGFDPREVRVLTDAQATQAGVLAGLAWLIDSAQAGDDLVLFVASHGSHVPDRDGDDGDDEVLVLHDHDWAGAVVTDDALAGCFARVPEGARLAAVWDLCHAGRAESDASSKKRVARYVAPPETARKQSSRGAKSPAKDRKKPRAGAGEATHGALGALVHEGLAAVSWAGCAAGETAVEASFGGMHEGAFAHALLDVLRRTRDDLTWAELHARVGALMTELGVKQTPQLHVPRALERAPAFGGRAGRAATAATAATVTDRDDLTAIDRTIAAHEQAGRWAEAVAECWRRVERVSAAAEKVRTIEHIASIHRVILGDHESARRAAEAVLRIDPHHVAARAFVRS
jgi:hypothetical protein